MSEWVLYDVPWWAPWLWSFACYAVARFIVHYAWRKLRR